MNHKIISTVLTLGLVMSQAVFAAATTGSLGFEYEAEKEKATGEWSDTGYIIPGFVINNNPILDKVELLLGYSQMRTAGLGSASALGVRLRKNIEFSHTVEGFVRVAAGHTYMNATGSADYNWAYIEPGLEVKLNHTFGLAISDRVQNSIDGTKGQSVNSLRVGPNIEFDANNELELRYISTTGNYESDSYMAEYVYKF